ncbi:MAG: MBL fold metallo-hydrolase [DPANN group archaeon]|nr:MBL fold metallo-hydrolase [DPANN group archaeon]
MDRLIFLGTGGGRIVVANQYAGTGGFIVQTEGYQIWVDPGVGAVVRAKQFGVSAARTDIIYVTHQHIDHCNDVNAVVDAMTLGGIKQRGTAISTPTLINGSDKDQPWLNSAFKAYLKDSFAVKPGDKIKIDKLNFVATPARHDIEYCNGLRLETPKFTLGYTSDTAYFPELAEAYKGCSILILDVLKPGNEAWKTHFNSEDAAKLISEVKPELAILTHFGAKMLRANPIYEARNIQKKTGIRTLAAQDGMRIDLRSLASQTKLES